MRTKLLIKDQTSSEFIDVPLVSDIPISINYVQADVREPDKRNSSFSKSVEIYGSNEINLLFENLFDVNIVTNTFNPNKKCICKYLVDELEQFNGALQLTKVINKPDTNIIYVCQINGNEGNIFIDIGDKLLTDLDFSTYDHTYNRTNILASWSSYTAGTGYYYPFVDNGSNGGSQLNFKVEQFIPCFHAKEYIDKIITDAGYTYSSTFLNGTEFKRNIIYPNLSAASLSDTALSNRQFYVGLNSNSSITTQPFSVIAAGNFYNLYATSISFNRETSPFFDNASPTMYTSGVGTINENGQYNLTANLKTRLRVTKTGQISGVDYLMVYGYSVMVSIEKSADNGTTWFGLAAQIIQHQVQQNPDSSYNIITIDPITEYYERDFESVISTGNIQLSQGDKVRVKYIVFYDAFYRTINISGADFTPDSVQQTMLSGSTGSSFSCLVASSNLNAGNTIEVNQCLPKQIKQKDFFKWIMQMYNLFIDVDKEDATKLTIEPYTTYFRLTEGASSIVNWANKIDLDNPFEVNPLFLLEGREYEYTYKSDKDYYNQRYEKEYAEIFGRHKVYIDNDFMSQTKKNEIGFSPTPSVENNVIGAIYPKIYENTGTEIKPITSNIRILYANPSLTTSNPYNFADSSVGTTIQTTAFGYAGHTDNPLNPTIDLNFYFPKTVYYTYTDLAFTTGNLYNKYHKSYLENITGRDSKTVVANLWLNSLDIANFTFRKKYFIDNAYYIVNKIVDYNPLMERSTKVELIKIVDTTVFAPQKYPVITLGAIDRGDKLPIRPIKLDRTNINYSESSVQWNNLNTFISADSERVFLTNSENVQVIGVTDFVGVGLKDVIIDSTYNGKRLNSNEGIVLKSETILVTSAELLALNTTPKLLLTSNNRKINVIDVISEALDTSPFTAYTTGNVSIRFNNTSSFMARVQGILQSTAPRILRWAETSGGELAFNEDLYLSTGSNPTGGTFDIKITLTYYEL
jgi:hypothetical protein